MKKATLVLFIGLVLLSSIAYAKQYSDNWGDHGFRILRQKSSELSLNFSIEEYSVTEKEIKDKMYQTIHIPGVFLPNNEGAPDLPCMSRYIAVPEGAAVSFDIVDCRTEIIPNMEIAPAARLPFDTEKGPLDYHKDMQIYSKNAFYPEEPVVISDIRQIRGVDVVIVSVTPFQYNPVTKEMIVYRDMQIDIHFTGGTGKYGEDRLRSRWWDPIYAQSILNCGSIPEKDYSQTSSKDDGCDYLIVVPDNADFIAWADSIKCFRQKQGIITKVVTLTDIGDNTTTALEDYFDNAYTTWDPAPSAVLLLADYGTDGPTGSSIISPTLNFCVSDNVYADVDCDNLPDMHFARITARDADELEITISKFIDYETDPPTNSHFYDHPITCCGWQTERWFQICSEVVGGFWAHELGKTQDRINEIYSGDPNSDPWSTATNTSTVLAYFGQDGLGYIPSYPSDLGDWTGGTATEINTAINNGAFMVQHRDHGSITGWNEPSYQVDDLEYLYNDDLVFVFSINCLTGKYNDSSECLAEAFHRHEHRALGIIAASEVSVSFVNDTYAWGMYDLFWPEFMPDYGSDPGNSDWIYPCMGNAAGKIFLEGSSWPCNPESKYKTYYLFHHHGDAFTTVYSEMPQTLTVNHDSEMLSGLTAFNVTADLGAEICLSVNGEIIGTGIGAGLDPTSIEIESQQDDAEVLVTIIKQNYYRYEQVVPVVPFYGPYIIYENHTIDDSGANSNGTVDYGENILLGMTLKNVGNASADSVIAALSAEDVNIDFTDSTAYFGAMALEESVTITNAFGFTVSDAVEDQHYVVFDLHINENPDEEETKYEAFGIIINAPNFAIDSLSVSDETGNNNNHLDPGETVTISVEVTNRGHACSPEATGVLSSSSGYIDITSATCDLGSFDIEQQKTATFTVVVKDDAPSGARIPLKFNIAGGNYVSSDIFYEYVGFSVEDFEMGDFSAYDWEMGGNEYWTVVDTAVYEGNYCARSGAISGNRTSELSIDLDTNAGEISFFVKTSCEEGYDFLQFYIDDVLKQEWSREKSWHEVSFTVDDAGLHTFKWVYDKDYYGSAGSDCAWIDHITFPAIISPEPVFELAPYEVDFGSVHMGQDSTCQFTIYNRGGGTLLGEISTPDCFTVAETGSSPSVNVLSYSIASGGSITYDLTFAPEDMQSYDGSVTITVGSTSQHYLYIFATGIPEFSTDDNVFFERSELLGSFPNPAKGSAVINYHLKGSAANQNADIRIYNIHGAYIKTVRGTDGKAHVDTSDMPTGIYLYKLDTESQAVIKKMMVVK